MYLPKISSFSKEYFSRYDTFLIQWINNATNGIYGPFDKLWFGVHDSTNEYEKSLNKLDKDINKLKIRVITQGK